MKPARHDDAGYHPYYRQAQRTPLNFAIIDEVDNILIDEARTPLIISGPAFSDSASGTPKADDIARKLTELERKARQRAEGRRRHDGPQRHRGGRPAGARAGRPDQGGPAEPAAQGRLLRDQGEGADLPPDRRRGAGGRAAGGRGELLHGREHGVAAPDRQRAEGAPPVPARPALHDRRRTRGRTTSSASSSSTSSPAGPCSAGSGATGCTSRSRPSTRRTGCRSSRRRRRSPRSRCRTSSSCTGSSPA